MLKTIQRTDPAFNRRLLVVGIMTFEQALEASHPKVTVCRENYKRLLQEMNHRS